MSGAMAGSAILSAPSSLERLSVVTLTVNNICNLSCLHCYLQDELPAAHIADETVKAVLDSDCRHIAVVGKEPFANARSIQRVEQIVKSARDSGRTVSVITNGLNGRLAPRSLVRELEWLDVSLDGGARTYREYRRGSWPKLRSSIKALQENGLRELRVLHTLSEETISWIPDMIAASDLLGANLTVFSPYVRTRSFGTQAVTMASPEAVISSLSCLSHRPDVRLLLDTGYLSHFGDTAETVQVGRSLLGDRLVIVENDPIDRGFIRVTYDGFVLTPFESVNTVDYRSKGRPLREKSLNAWFDEMSPRSSLN